MSKRTKVVGVIAAVAAGAAMGAAPAGAAGPGVFHYAAQGSRVVTMAFGDGAGPCGASGTVTFDERVNASGAATVAGLSGGQFLALVNDDPDGALRQVHVTATGDLDLVTGGHTYRGRVTETFDGHFLPNGMYVQTGTFSVTATSELGTRLHIESGGHDVDGFDGLTKVAVQHGSVDGCLP